LHTCGKSGLQIAGIAVTKLLVSVRNREEAAVALAAGADLIDVKEPRRGSLGAADPGAIREVVDQAAGAIPVSAALGELTASTHAGPPALPSGIRFAKIGLAGCRSDETWPARWRAFVEALPGGTQPVAVVYADWRTCEAPPPDAVLSAAADIGCTVFLVDTYDKSRGGLFDHWPSAELSQWAEDARRLGGLLVLAGSLSLATIPSALELPPDYIAVRGAACRGGREGRLDQALLRELVRLVQGGNVVARAARDGALRRAGEAE
jgi:uncharacterized protein (UPF0264 family)